MAKITNINYAKKLRFLRTTVGIKQAEMASKLSISQQAYSVLENGKTHFTDKLINSICVIFNIAFQDFIKLEVGAAVGSKNEDSLKTKILTLHYEKLLIEKELEIVQLKLELKGYKKLIKTSKVKTTSVYVMI